MKYKVAIFHACTVLGLHWVVWLLPVPYYNGTQIIHALLYGEWLREYGVNMIWFELLGTALIFCWPFYSYARGRLNRWIYVGVIAFFVLLALPFYPIGAGAPAY